MARLDFKGKWVLITGASAGLGREMAVQLAVKHGANLILMARRGDKLEEVKVAILEKVHVEVVCRTCDLADSTALEAALDTLLREMPIYGAILNAGMTYFGRHLEMEANTLKALLDLNVKSVVLATNKLAQYFEARKQEGALMLVSSMAAQFPTPYQAIYSGTKAFLLNFGLALGQELQNEHFSITVYLPSGIATEMTANEKFGKLKGYLMPVSKAAREAIYAFSHRKRLWIPGRFNRLVARLSWFIPKHFVLQQTAKTYLKSLMAAAEGNKSDH